MALGKAAVYKHIPVYYPKNVGSVGGLVGMIGGLGGFVLPIAFGALNDLTGIWTSCFMLLFVLVSGALAVDACGDPADGARRRRRGARQAAATAGNAGDPRAGACRRAVRRGAAGLAAGGQGVLGDDRARHRPAQSVDLDPGAAARPSRSGRCGRWSSRSCRRSASTSPPISCSGSRRCRAFPARCCASSTPSWCRSSAAGCGPRSRPGR